MQKNTYLMRLLLILFCAFIPLESKALEWDISMSSPWFTGRTEQFYPLGFETKFTSVKGYGLGYTWITPDNSNDTTKDQEQVDGDIKYDAKLDVSNNIWSMYYRMEKYVHRWDFGLMYNSTTYTATYTTTENSEEVSNNSIFVVNYAGPFLQYSNTWIGYDVNDAFYSISFAPLTRTAAISNSSFKLPSSPNTEMQKTLSSYDQYVIDHNPDQSFFVNFSFGWRL